MKLADYGYWIVVYRRDSNREWHRVASALPAILTVEDFKRKIAHYEYWAITLHHHRDVIGPTIYCDVTAYDQLWALISKCKKRHAFN